MSYVVMTPRQAAHMRAAVRSLLHATDIVETRALDLGPENKAVLDQLVKSCSVAMEELKLVLDIENIARGPKRLT